MFGESFPSISELIHLARCVKVNLYFNPGIVLIGLSVTETNRRLNFILGLGRFNCGLALIGFRTTGACTTVDHSRYICTQDHNLYSYETWLPWMCKNLHNFHHSLAIQHCNCWHSSVYSFFAYFVISFAYVLFQELYAFLRCLLLIILVS